MLAVSHDSAHSQLDLYGSLDVSFLAFLLPDKIKAISHTVHFRLCQVAPVAVAQRLPNSRRFMEGATVTKDMIKQHLE